MTQIGFYVKEPVQRWYLENLDAAKKILSSFEDLNILFNNFEGYERKKFTMNHNVVLGHTLPDLNGKYKPDYKKVLDGLNHVVELFRIIENNSRDYKHLRSRLNADNYNTSVFAFDELYLGNDLALKFGMENVKLMPKLKDGTSDVLVTLGTKKIFFELTVRNLNTPEGIIQSISNQVAEHIGKQTSKNDSYLVITFDPKKLIRDEKENIDEKGTVSFLKNMADRLKISALVGYNGYFDLNTSWLITCFGELTKKKDESFYENHFNKFKKYNFPNEWLLQKNSELIQNSPFIGFEGGKSNGLKIIVEARNELTFGPGTLELSGIKRQIFDKIREKSENQLESGLLNILVLRGVIPYSHSFLGSESMTEITRMQHAITEFLEKNIFENISGIIFFNRLFNEAKLILNPHAKGSSKLDDNTIKQLEFPIYDDNNQGLILGYTDTEFF